MLQQEERLWGRKMEKMNSASKSAFKCLQSQCVERGLCCKEMESRWGGAEERNFGGTQLQFSILQGSLTIEQSTSSNSELPLKESKQAQVFWMFHVECSRKYLCI